MSEQIRVLQVFGKMDCGGAETFIMNVYRNIDRKKVQFDFIIHSEDEGYYDKEIESLGGRIYRVPKFKILNYFNYAKAWNDFFKMHKQYKIIHGHIYSVAGIYMSIAKKYGLKTVVHSHSTQNSGNWLTKLVKDRLVKKLGKQEDYLMACSKVAGEWCFGKNNQFDVINNAIDVSRFKFNPLKRSELRNKMNLDDSFVIMHVGRFDSSKNHSFLIDIFYKICEINDKAVLMLIGKGKLKDGIEVKVKTLGLEDKVMFLGYRNDVPDLLQAADIFLFPSLYEGLGIVLIEAQASGLPCIISDVVPSEAIITQLVEQISLKDSATIWANKVLEYSEEHERKDMSQEIISAGFDIKEVSKILEDFYINCCNV